LVEKFYLGHSKTNIRVRLNWFWYSLECDYMLFTKNIYICKKSIKNKNTSDNTELQSQKKNRHCCKNSFQCLWQKYFCFRKSNICLKTRDSARTCATFVGEGIIHILKLLYFLLGCLWFFILPSLIISHKKQPKKRQQTCHSGPKMTAIKHFSTVCARKCLPIHFRHSVYIGQTLVLTWTS
jgi:TM2 domain-containing membrane protein YozV